eukprot:8603265-Lingulodinium_polyedra.AAC.1
MGNQDKFLHETAILLLIWMYDIRHARPHVFHHECANEFEEGIMADVLSDYDMASASAVWSRLPRRARLASECTPDGAVRTGRASKVTLRLCPTDFGDPVLRRRTLTIGFLR